LQKDADARDATADMITGCEYQEAAMDAAAAQQQEEVRAGCVCLTLSHSLSAIAIVYVWRQRG